MASIPFVSENLSSHVQTFPPVEHHSYRDENPNNLSEDELYQVIKERLAENDKILHAFKNNLRDSLTQKNIPLMEAFNLNCKAIGDL